MIKQDGYALYNDNNDQSPAVTDICGVLYDESAKCNKYMGNDASSSYTVSQFGSQTSRTNLSGYNSAYTPLSLLSHPIRQLLKAKFVIS